MKTSKVLLAGIVIILSGAIIWYVGFSGKITDLSSYSTVNADPVLSQEQADTNAPGQADPNGAAPPSDSNEPNKTPNAEPASQTPKSLPEAANDSGKEPGTKPEGKAEAKAGRREGKKVGDPNASEDPNAPKKPKVQMEALNLKDVQMKDIVKKITEWTGKVVIPMGEAMNQKITIYSPKEMTRPKALSLIFAALRTKGYTAEEDGDVLYLKPLTEAKLGKVPVIGPGEPLALYENKEQIVQKFFKLTNYNPEDMQRVIEPFIAEYGMVTSDAATGTVAAIETINNLIRIQTVIDQFDVPEAEQMVSEMIAVRNGDPAEVVQLLRLLLDSSESGGNSRRSSYSRYGSRDSSISTTVAGQGKMPIILIPQSKNKIIIVRASAQDMTNVKEWIKKLDLTDAVESEYETVSVNYASPREVARGIEDAMRDMPGSELRPNVLVRPLDQSRQVMIFGREDLRQAVKDLIKEIDMPSGVFETKNFELEYADPDQVRENIENLYETDNQNSGDYYSYMRRMRSNTNPTDIVKVIPLSTMQRVTVIASAENMRKIEEQIKEWDTPLDVDQEKPRIISLRNSDPVQMAQLLSKLFSEEDDSSSQFIRMIFNGSDSQMKKKIIGPLYGLLTFEAVPGTKKIIVISKVPEAYQVIEDLIEELDGQEMAEVPEVIQLNYADPESLAERLNALFNESGTNARFRLSDQGLSAAADSPGGNNTNANNNNRTQNNNNSQSAGYFEGYWNQQRISQNEEPISNVIGKVRFIPDVHSKSLLVLSAPEFMDSIKAMIHDLDVPGKQVLVKAIVLEVDHSSMTSLGVQLSTNPASFGEIGENAVNALTELKFLETRGSGSITSGADIYALIDFLEKNVNAKILNQQSLWTKDNEMATFFKGDLVPFEAGSSAGTQAVTKDVTFEEVGMTLEVRPSITPEDRVDMEVRVELSQLKDEIVNGQPVRGSMETDTKMIVNSGETIMLGGILFQKDSLVQRKVPLLGDVPLLGMLFRHKAEVQTNNELIIFIIPEVIDDGAAMAETVNELMEAPLKTLENVKETINQDFRKAGIIDPND